MIWRLGFKDNVIDDYESKTGAVESSAALPASLKGGPCPLSVPIDDMVDSTRVRPVSWRRHAPVQFRDECRGQG
jgi:hypothetical protein